MPDDMTKPLTGIRVLLVEDEAFIAMAIIDKLTEAGAETVEHALSLSEAKQRRKHTSIDVAILDLRLPDGNTDELAEDLVADQIPIVFHSGHAEIEMLRAKFPSAIICHKPCRHSEFVDAIRVLMSV